MPTTMMLITTVISAFAKLTAGDSLQGQLQPKTDSDLLPSSSSYWRKSRTKLGETKLSDASSSPFKGEIQRDLPRSFSNPLNLTRGVGEGCFASLPVSFPPRTPSS